MSVRAKTDTLAVDEPVGAEHVAEPSISHRPSVRSRLHRGFTRRRGAVVKVHRWVSLVLVLWVAVEAVTGSAIVFGDQIDRWWNTEVFSSTPGDVGADAAIDAARSARDADQVSSITLPGATAADGMYRVLMIDAAGEYHWVVIDPGSGDVTSTDHEWPELLRVLREVHFDLNSTSVFGMEGMTAVSLLGVAWLVVLLSGFYIWYWPGVKRWARIVRVRRSRGSFTRNMDLHKAVGIIVFVPLLLVVVTGIQFGLPDPVRAVYEVMTFGSYDDQVEPAPLSTPVSGAEPIGVDRTIEIVEAIDPSIRIQSVSTPGGSPVGVYEAHAVVDAAFLAQAGGQRDVHFPVDQYSGSLIDVEDPADLNTATRVYDDWSYRVHFGTFAGISSQFVWLGLGGSIIVLGTTGTLMFVHRTRRRRAARRRAADSDSNSTSTITSTETRSEGAHA